MDSSLPGSSAQGISGKNTEVGCHFPSYFLNSQAPLFAHFFCLLFIWLVFLKVVISVFPCHMCLLEEILMTLPIAKIILAVKCIILDLIILCFKLKFHTAHDVYIYIYLYFFRDGSNKHDRRQHNYAYPCFQSVTEPKNAIDMIFLVRIFVIFNYFSSSSQVLCHQFVIYESKCLLSLLL